MITRLSQSAELAILEDIEKFKIHNLENEEMRYKGIVITSCDSDVVYVKYKGYFFYLSKEGNEAIKKKFREKEEMILEARSQKIVARLLKFRSSK